MINCRFDFEYFLMMLLPLGCGGIAEESPLEKESAQESPLTDCERIQAEPSMQCENSGELFDCAPHDEGAACYVPEFGECYFYEWKDVKCDDD